MKSKLLPLVGLVFAGVAVWTVVLRGKGGENEIEYRYATVERGELLRSISATGQLVALTNVDVKSKAGGKVVRLAVDEGSVVKRGDLIALIDPSDTQAIYDQTMADLRSAQARTAQAESSLQVQLAGAETSVADAEAALGAAQARLERIRLEASRAPKLSSAALQTARANLVAAEQAYQKAERVTVPQKRRDVEGEVRRTQSARDAADAEVRRQRELLDRGYVAQGAVERAAASAEAARAAFETARQRQSMLEEEITAELRSEAAALERARASLREAEANQAQDGIALRNLQEAEKALRQAEVNLRKARNEGLNSPVRRQEIAAATATADRTRVSLKNAKVQLDSTTVVAPRDGVVTLKYLEEGTIIPPGTSTFAQGTSLVQISDVSEMFVECAVDETDIGQVKVGQRVRILTEAFPGRAIPGIVQRVNPAAQTEQNITAVKVRVKVLPGSDVSLLPGMNATCEFITLEKQGIVIVPNQAVRNEGVKAFVRIKGSDPLKPEIREVQVGETGNQGIEILSGLQEGDEVVVAEINLAELREIQRRMQEAEEGGGLAGGSRPGGGGGTRPRAGTAGGAGGGAGGARPGGGGGR
jgi:HlyD family secretion protein